jgi:uncharacterized protein (TIGR00645 family)
MRGPESGPRFLLGNTNFGGHSCAGSRAASKPQSSSRWLTLPLLFGLVLGLVVLIGRFFVDLWEIISQIRSSAGKDVIIGLLSLIDFALTANLILIVIFSGYENYISEIDPADHPGWLDGITQVDFGELKQKLLGSIVAIAAVDSLGCISSSRRQPTPPSSPGRSPFRSCLSLPC